MQENHGAAASGLEGALDEKQAPVNVALAKERIVKYDPELVRQSVAATSATALGIAKNISDCTGAAASTPECQKLMAERVLPNPDFVTNVNNILPQVNPTVQARLDHEAIFNTIDSNNDGELTAYEILQHFSDASVCGWTVKHGINSCADGPDVFWSFDDNADHHIVMEEFCRGLKKLQNAARASQAATEESSESSSNAAPSPGPPMTSPSAASPIAASPATEEPKEEPKQGPLNGSSKPMYMDKGRPLFAEGWQDTLVDKSFLSIVNSWKSTDMNTCSLGVTHRSVSGYQRRSKLFSKPGATSAVDVVEKHVQVTIPKIREERVPYVVNITQDRMVYQTTIQKVPKYVPVETVQRVRREVEVPKIVEVVKNVTVPGPINQLMRKREKKVKMEVVTVRVDQVAVPMVLLEETPVYHNVTKKVQRHVTTPKLTKRQIFVNVTKIEEVLVELPANVTFPNSTGLNTSYGSDPIEVEVAKVTVKEIKVPVQIMRDKVVYKTVKQAVERRVEKPEVQVKQRLVEVPEYREVLRQVPIVEVRNRTVDLIREELVIEDEEELVNVTKERLVQSEIATMKSVPVVTETPQMSYENIDVAQVELQVTNQNHTESVNAEERTNITQEVITTKEVIEYVDKIVDVIVEQEEIVEVPRRVTRTVMKEVVVENMREEIVQVPEPQIITITREEPEIVFESVDVILHREELVINETSRVRMLHSEQIVPVQTWEEIQVTRLKPKPFPVSETDAVIDMKQDNYVAVDGSPIEGNFSRVQEQVIVQDFVEQEVVKQVQFAQTNIVTRDVHIPVFQIEEEEIPVPTVRYEDDIVEVEKVYEQEKLVEVPGPPVDTYFDEDIIVPEYVEKNVVARVEVPHVTFNKTVLAVPIYRMEEEIISVTQEIFEDEIVEVPQIVKVNRYVPHGSTGLGNSTNLTDFGLGATVTYVEREVIQEMQVAEPVYVDRIVEVPVYEVEEVIVEVLKVTIVEEIVEVPRIIEIERIVEVPTVEYNDVVVERVVKKRVKQKQAKENVIYVDKVVEKHVEHMSVDNQIKYVDLKVQVPNYRTQVKEVMQAETKRSLAVSQKTINAVKPKEIVVKKRIERLIPNEIVKIVRKHVEVLHETITEKVVPIYKETVVRKEVKVPVIAVRELIVKKQLLQQVANSTSSSFQKTVDLYVEHSQNQTSRKEVPIRTMLKPIVEEREVPIAVPCGGTGVAPTPSPADTVV